MMTTRILVTVLFLYYGLVTIRRVTASDGFAPNKISNLRTLFKAFEKEMTERDLERKADDTPPPIPTVHGDSIPTVGSDKRRGMPAKRLDNDEDEDQKLDTDELQQRLIHALRDLQYPTAYGVNMDQFASTHPAGFLRAGQASNSHSCHTVSTVPAQLRDNTLMKPPVPEFYQKYTEAYGIPIVGSSNVTDVGLMRTCYTLRYMFGGRYDVRNAYYKVFGRVMLIGDGEQQTDLWEYRSWSDYWDTRARGLGPTIGLPLTSVGDDNQRCTNQDRYKNQDIFAHEFGHTADLMGAQMVIEGFARRLSDAYSGAIAAGKWSGVYAGTNVREYWATGSQFFLNAVSGFEVKPDAGDGEVTSADDLRTYDQPLYDLLAEVYPCENGDFIERCAYKKPNTCAGIDSLTLISESSAQMRPQWSSACSKLTSFWSLSSVADCAQVTCAGGGNVFAYNVNNGKCLVILCENVMDVPLVDAGKPYAVYTSPAVFTPEPLSREPFVDIATYCTNAPSADTGRSCAVDSGLRTACGPDDVNEDACSRIGCCWDSSQCYYPHTDCFDLDINCGAMATTGECTRNPGFLYKKCPFSCGVCQYIPDVISQEMIDAVTCLDTNQACRQWRAAGYCNETSPYNGYMTRTCPLVCEFCSLDLTFDLAY